MLNLTNELINITKSIRARIKSEQNTINWLTPLHKSTGTSESAPTDFTNAEEVGDVRRVLFQIVPSDLNATYSLSVYGGSTTSATNAPLKLDSADYTDLQGSTLIGVNVDGLDRVEMIITALSAGTIDIEVGEQPLES